MGVNITLPIKMVGKATCKLVRKADKDRMAREKAKKESKEADENLVSEDQPP